MRRLHSWSGVLLGLVLLLPACASLSPLRDGDESDLERSLNALSVPLDLQDYRIVNADGHRSVFLKLSRLPDEVGDRTENDPPRVILEIKGPTGIDAPEEAFAGNDALISTVRVERAFGVLRVTLELQGRDFPPYSVHRMADWVMIRFGK